MMAPQTKTTPDPLEKYEHVEYPIRDDAQLGPTEDLDREPDGFPHLGIGVLIFTSIALAVLVLLVWTRSEVAAIILMVIAAPALIIRITRKSGRSRDRVHPAR